MLLPGGRGEIFALYDQRLEKEVVTLIVPKECGQHNQALSRQQSYYRPRGYLARWKDLTKYPVQDSRAEIFRLIELIHVLSVAGRRFQALVSVPNFCVLLMTLQAKFTICSEVNDVFPASATMLIFSISAKTLSTGWTGSKRKKVTLLVS